MTRHARIEIRPQAVDCDPHPLDVACPINGPLDEQCQRVLAPSLRPHYIRLLSANGQVLATSELYANRQNARRAVRSWVEAFCDVLNLTKGWADSLRPGSVNEYDVDGGLVL